MITIQKLKSGREGNAGAISRYLFADVPAELFSDEAALANYYAKAGPPAGVWVGTGLEALGLTDGDRVTPSQFMRLLEGKHPETGEDLQPGRTTPGSKGRIVGYDFTVTVDKSASILYAAGNEETRAAIEAAKDASIDAAIRYLEKHACRVTKGAGGKHQAEGGGLIVGRFDHLESRPMKEGEAGDPHLHSHLVVMNVTRGPDGKLQALDSPELYQHRMAAGYLQEMVFRMELRERLGIEWTPADEKGLSKIVGLPEKLRAEFSKRRSAVILDAHKKGLDVENQKVLAVSQTTTREKKERVRSIEELEAGWQNKMRELGYEPSLLLERARKLGKAARVDRELAQLAREVIGDSEAEPSDWGIVRELTKMQATFDRRDVVRFLATHAERLGLRSLEDVEARADQVLASEEVVSLAGLEDFREQVFNRYVDLTGDLRKAQSLTDQLLGRGDTPDGGFTVRTKEAPRFTSVGNLEDERYVMAAVGVSDPTLRTASEAQIDRILQLRSAAGQTLGPDQERMVRAVTGGDRILVPVQGPAGTGKGFTLGVAADIWRSAGLKPIGCSTAAVAAQRLEKDTGIPSMTITLLRIQLGLGNIRLDRDSVVVVDEIGMVDNYDFAWLVSETRKAGCRLVCVGDFLQLSAVAAGGAWTALNARHPREIVELTENRRQKEKWERIALAGMRQAAHLSEEQLEDLVGLYKEHGALREAETEDKVFDQMVEDYFAALLDGRSSILLAYHRKSVEALNEAARKKAATLGLLGEKFSFAGRQWQEGERVIATANMRHLGLLNGSTGTVLGRVEVPVRWKMTLQREDESTFEVETKRPRQVGEKLWEATISAVEPVETVERLAIKLDDGETALVPPSDEAECLESAWATTVHKAQGATVDASFSYGRGFHRNLLYTALSRGRHENALYFAVGENAVNSEHDHEGGCSVLCRSSDIQLNSVEEQMKLALERDGVEEAALEVGLQQTVESAERLALEDERRQLAHVIATCPPSVEDLRRLAELRATEAELRGDAAEVKRLKSEIQRLSQDPRRLPEERMRRQWFSDHKKDLDRWREITYSMDDGTAVLVASRYLPKYLGEATDDPAERVQWQEKALMLEVYRRRWGVSPSELDDPAHARDPEQAFEYVAMRTAVEALNAPDLELAPEVAPEVAAAPELVVELTDDERAA